MFHFGWLSKIMGPTQSAVILAKLWNHTDNEEYFKKLYYY